MKIAVELVVFIVIYNLGRFGFQSLGWDLFVGGAITVIVANPLSKLAAEKFQ